MAKRMSLHNQAERRLLLHLTVAPEDPGALQSLRDLNPFWTELQFHTSNDDEDEEDLDSEVHGDPEWELSILLRRIAHHAWEYDPNTQDPQKWIARMAKREIRRMDAIQEREVDEDLKINLLTGRVVARNYLFNLFVRPHAAKRKPTARLT